MKNILTLLLLGSTSLFYSQTDYSSVYNNNTIINNGISLYDKEKYLEAIKEFDKISKLDPKFLNAQYEKGMALSALEKKEEAKAFFEDLYKKNLMPEFSELYTLYGNFLSDQKEYELSEKIFKEGEKYLSNSSTFLYNFAVLYVRKEETQKSVDLLERILTINPNHASSHYLLGALALDNGKITEGTLALLSYLMIAPNGSYAEKAILNLNAKFGQNYLEKHKLIFSKSGDNFEEIETILRNQLPLKSAYKINSEIDDVIIRQVQAVAEYTLEHKMGDGFFETTYIPWLKDLVERKQFEGFSYYILLGMEEKIGKKLTSQKKKITAFNDNYLDKYFWDKFGKRKLDLFGKEQEVIVSIKNRIPYLIGAIIDGKSEGKHKFLNEDGNLQGELNFKNNELDGVQKYFDEKGNITDEKSFLNGKLDGKKTKYYSNGNISLIENYKDGKLEGVSTSYAVNGGKECEVNFINGERNGKLICLYVNGNKKSESNYSNGKLNGPYLVYNEIGDITESYNYINDLYDGKYLQYYDGKIVKAEAVYSNGVVQGSYKKYYSNKVLEREVFYENGKVKKAIDYYANGKKSAESIYNDKAELENYASFDSNENKYFEEKNKSGDLKSGIQFLKNSPKPIEVSMSKKPFIMNNYEGKKLVIGDFEKSKKIGEWNYFYNSGHLRLKENYIKGIQNGLCQSYDRNGLISTIKNYTNDTINGLYEVYENGKLNRIYNYEKGEQNGPFKNFNSDGSIYSEGYLIDGDVNFNKFYYWQNGTISSKDKFIDDMRTATETFNFKGEKENSIDFKNRTGKFSVNYNNGTTTQVCDMVNGVFNGKFLEKDKFNNPTLEIEYINGVRYNSYKSYSPLGTLKRESFYYDGKLNGIDKIYDLVGNLRLVEENTFGDENGIATRYYQNKSKLFEYNRLDGAIDGEYKYYNQKGEPVLTLGYRNNSVFYYIRKSKTGELNEKIDIIDETATIVSKYPNGKIAMKLNIIKGNFEGEFAIYNESGKPEYEANYEKNILNGERKEYYSNGVIYKRERFKNNDYEGLQEYYKESGKPWLTAEYKNDELHGNTLIYEEGKLVVTKKYNSDELVEIIK